MVLDRWPSVSMIAAGKASAAMARAAAVALGVRLRQGIVIGPEEAPVPSPLRHIRAEHPEPGENSALAGRVAIALAQTMPPDDLLLVLLSGGASSLMAQPRPGLTIEEKKTTAHILMRAGADIHELNTVRKHLSAIKGGQLAAASAAVCLTLVVSDVVGDDTSIIASGPTVPDPSTYTDALSVVQRRGGLEAFPEAVARHLTRGAAGVLPETPKPGDPRLGRSTVHVIGSRRVAMSGAMEEAERRGYHVHAIRDAIVGEARTAARDYFALVRQLVSAVSRPCCIVSGGETTVTVTGKGRGGRNQEFALALVEELDGLGSAAALASFGTDGVDGPTDAAGAITDSSTLTRAGRLGLDPGLFLSDNDAYHFFAATGDLIKTGPTGTNVGDLQVILLA